MLGVSCDRESIVENDTVQNQASAKITTTALAASTYYSTPTVGNSVPNANVAITGSCGTHYGLLKATMKSAGGGSFTVRISMQNGALFVNSGTAYLKENSLCGPIGGSTTFSGPNTYVDVTITPSFTQGIKHYYPLIILSSGVRYYAEPILIYTTPMYNTNWIYGNVLGTVNNVAVRCNGSTNLSVAANANNQCTEFCARYYQQVYGRYFTYSTAHTWYGTASGKGLTAYPNGGTVAPRPGDILCMSGGAGGYGHVAIIIEVGTTYIKIAQQNTGTSTGGGWEPIGASLSRTGNSIGSPSSSTASTAYTVQGWLRIP